MTTTQHIGAINQATSTKDFQGNNWGARHATAFAAGQSDFARAIAGLIKAAGLYCDVHKKQYESPIGEDYVLGKGLLEILSGTATLLNGELGGLDGGTCDQLLRDIARLNGYTEQEIDEI